MNRNTLLCILLLASTSPSGTRAASMTTIDIDGPLKPISPDLFGIFFEDLNYAADGGLYAELVQNRSFEYAATEQAHWTPMTAWELVQRDGGKGSARVADAFPVHVNNSHYVALEVQQAGGGVGLANAGFDGIAVNAGRRYDFSVFARQLFTGNHWGGSGRLETPAQLVVRLESRSQAVLAETALETSGRDWQHLTASLTATNSDASARLVVLCRTKGGIALDEISLLPRETFKNRPNGLRADLAQAIADLHPKFIRFPGGCLVHGYGLGNMYNWKESIGPVEQRRGKANLWGYHQSLGLGYYEYFQFCEDIGAKPLPVVPAGVCCQNADNQGGTGQRGLPLDQMPAYIQDVLDLIEWANGPTNSHWGAERAAAGHPESFHLQYLGVGNEEHITPVFEERFKMIYAALKTKHPEINVIGTAGPFWKGEDYDNGWKIANELQLPIVDEHYYESPKWFLQNLNRYDRYDRAKSKVYVGEYAAHDKDRVNTLRSALAEAAYMTALERNGDVVRLTSYAPLLCKQGRSQWRPDMIYFDNTNLLLSANYYVQQMFGQNSGDGYYPAKFAPADADLAMSCVRDSKSGDVIVKLINVSTNSVSTRVNLGGIARVKPQAARTILAADPDASNTFGRPRAVVPQTESFTASESFQYEAPPYSFTVIRMKSE